MTEDQIKKLEKSKDENVLELLDEYKRIMASNNLQAYLSLRDQLKDWDEQLIIKPDEVRKIIRMEGKEDEYVDEVTPGRIDLFADKDTKEYDRVLKYFERITALRKTLIDLKASLTEDETVLLKESDAVKKSKEKNQMLSI